MIFFKKHRKKLAPEPKIRTFEKCRLYEFRPGRTGTGPAPAWPGLLSPVKPLQGTLGPMGPGRAHGHAGCEKLIFV